MLQKLDYFLTHKEALGSKNYFHSPKYTDFNYSLSLDLLFLFIMPSI